MISPAANPSYLREKTVALILAGIVCSGCDQSSDKARIAVPELSNLLHKYQENVQGEFKFSSVASSGVEAEVDGRIVFRHIRDDLELGPQGPLGLFVGVEHQFEGTVCIPEDLNESEMHVSSQEERAMNQGQLEYIALTYKGSILLNDKRGFVVHGVREDPLRLRILAEGYQYLSGTGTVTTPAGHVYSFSDDTH